MVGVQVTLCPALHLTDPYLDTDLLPYICQCEHICVADVQGAGYAAGTALFRSPLPATFGSTQTATTFILRRPYGERKRSTF